MALTVAPGAGRLFVRPEHDDVIVVLTSVEGTSRWGVVVCVDVFRVAVAELASPTTPEAAKPLARLVQPRGENNWRLSDVLVGDASLFVDLDGDPDVRRVYQLDLNTADWHDVSIGEQIVRGIATRNYVVIDAATGEQHEVCPTTSRPLPDKLPVPQILVYPPPTPDKR